jgi:hypothetical protein
MCCESEVQLSLAPAGLPCRHKLKGTPGPHLAAGTTPSPGPAASRGHTNTRHTSGQNLPPRPPASIMSASSSILYMWPVPVPLLAPCPHDARPTPGTWRAAAKQSRRAGSCSSHILPTATCTLPLCTPREHPAVSPGWQATAACVLPCAARPQRLRAAEVGPGLTESPAA